MSTEEKELFFAVMEEAYLKGLTSSEISVLGFVNEIKQKLLPVINKGNS